MALNENGRSFTKLKNNVLKIKKGKKKSFPSHVSFIFKVDYENNEI